MGTVTIIDAMEFAVSCNNKDTWHLLINFMDAHGIHSAFKICGDAHYKVVATVPTNQVDAIKAGYAKRRYKPHNIISAVWRNYEFEEERLDGDRQLTRAEWDYLCAEFGADEEINAVPVIKPVPAPYKWNRDSSTT